VTSAICRTVKPAPLKSSTTSRRRAVSVPGRVPLLAGRGAVFSSAGAIPDADPPHGRYLTKIRDYYFTDLKWVRGKSVRPTPVVSRMTSIRYPNSSPDETNASRWYLKKARDCRRAALTAKDPKVRLVFFNLAKMWREMADEAEPETETVEPSKGIGVVIYLP
jgi:hypothetical protein